MSPAAPARSFPVLAGPILRRVTAGLVDVWLCTRQQMQLAGRCYALDTRSGEIGDVIGSGETIRCVQIGLNLYVSLVRIKPHEEEGFPPDAVVAYDIRKSPPATARWSGVAGLADLTPVQELLLGKFPLPTFVIPSQRTQKTLRVLFGSCRKLHGHGEDASRAALATLEAHATDPQERITTLILSGDQIYGDDTAASLLPFLSSMGRAVLGYDEAISGTSTPLHKLSLRERRTLLRNRKLSYLSTGELDFHLLGLGEFSAMYLLAWNPGLWPVKGGAATSMELIPPSARGMLGAEDGGTDRREKRDLDDARLGAAALRRALANVSTYMIFDDHEVTDDWNFDEEWTQKARKPLTDVIITNALCAYWAFQGWGNAPEDFGEQSFIKPLEAALAQGTKPEVRAEAVRNLAAQLPDWSVLTETNPPMLLLDTRTARGRQLSNAASDRVLRSKDDDSPLERVRVNRSSRTVLLKEDAVSRLAVLARRAARDGRLLLVIPTPVFSLPMQDELQKLLEDLPLLDRYDVDREGWRANPESLEALIQRLIVATSVSKVFIAAGDVHFSHLSRGRVYMGRRQVESGQLVSSAMKNCSFPSVGKSLLRRRHTAVEYWPARARGLPDGFDYVAVWSDQTARTRAKARQVLGDPQFGFEMTFENLNGYAIETENTVGRFDVHRSGIEAWLVVQQNGKAIESPRMRM